MTPDIAQAFEHAEQARREGRFEAARALYQTILKGLPGHPDANYNLGVLEVSANNPGAGLPFLKKALESSPKNRDFWITYIDALIAAEHPDSARTVLEKGKSLGLSGADVEALDRQLVPGHDSPLPDQADLHRILEGFQNGRFGEAETLAVEMTRKFPDHPFSWQILAAIFYATGRKDGALSASERVVEIDPADAEAHSNLGNIYLELGRHEDAETSFRSSIGLNGALPEARNNLAVTLRELGRLDEAEATYRQAISLKPDYAEALSNLGNLLKELGRIDEAEACHSRAIAANPDYAPAYLNRGQISFDRGDYDAALSDFDCCNTEDARARALSCLYALGRIDDIYETIDAKSDTDETNIRVAAFSAFISAQQSRETANSFCPNPLDFLHFSNLSSHVENPDLLIAEIIAELQDIQSTWEPRNRSTRKGFQSKINLFDDPPENIGVLKDIITSEIDAYHAKYENRDCTFIREWPADRNFRSWYVVLKQQGYQDLHIHPSGWLSGVVYLKVVPALENDEGAIEFNLNGESYRDPGSPKLTYRPNLGDIVLFPSSLHHRTIPFTTDTDRIIISFDLRPD